jgi:uncharacterized protein (UPF0335 family)
MSEHQTVESVDLARLRELESRATPGPWTVQHYPHGDPYSIDCENAKIGGASKLFDVRGWGYFTGKGHGALGLTAAEGVALQEANSQLVCALRNAFPHLLARIERLEAEIADLRHDVERAVASASDLATELVRKDAALREALPFVESTYENESGEEAADAKYVMDKITAALEQSNG